MNIIKTYGGAGNRSQYRCNSIQALYYCARQSHVHGPFILNNRDQCSQKSVNLLSHFGFFSTSNDKPRGYHMFAEAENEER